MGTTYINFNTCERTQSASLALKWHNAGDSIELVKHPKNDICTQYSIVRGAKVETERERFDREEGRERCERLADELDAYADGNMYKCPECGEIVEMPETVGDKFKCYHCGETSELSDYEQLGIYDYMEDMLDIDFTVNRYKEYQSCSVCIGFGGPNIFIETADAYIKLYWGSTREQYPIKYSTRDAVDEWAQEYYECL